MNNFTKVTEFLPRSLQKYFVLLPDEIKENTYEIRLRLNKPVILFGNYGVLFVNKDMTFSGIDYKGAYCISESELKETVSSVCKYSVYSHQNEIINGFVTFGKGNRAGFAGTAVVDNGKISMISDISGVNIRIASENYSLLSEIKCLLFDFSGILIVGPPCSGKTTVLKAISETLSSEYSFGFQKTVVIDERFEMQDISGINCDILAGYPKAKGIEHAVRTLSPQVIICDEIISSEEIERMKDGMYCGVKFIASMHLSSMDDIRNSPLFRKLSELKIFDYVVFLKDGINVGEIDRIIRTEDIYYDNNSCNNYSGFIGSCSVYNNS